MVQRAQERLEAAYQSALPHGLVRYPVPFCEAMVRRLTPAVDAEGRLVRKLTPEEDAFIGNEEILTKIDFRYWAERYCKISTAMGLQNLSPMWESQEIILGRLAALERDRAESGHPDGLLANILKARQEGVSTLLQALLTHRITTHTYVNAMTASDVPENSGSEGQFGKCELIVQHLPWYLKPAKKFHKKDTHLAFANGSWVTVESGKSMKGGLQDAGGTKGNLGRSKTFSVIHLTEISTWERPEQIEDGLMPAVPRSPRTLMGKESTAKGRHNWHHEDWLQSVRGRGRFIAIFLPWYALAKYWLPAPVDWVPSATTLAHATKVTQEGPQWLGRSVTLSRNQLYWYEETRATYAERGDLAKFLEEYAADPEECFQHSGKSIFTHEQLEYLDRLAKPPIAVWGVNPARDLSDIRQSELAEIRRLKALALEHADTPAPEVVDGRD